MKSDRAPPPAAARPPRPTRAEVEAKWRAHDHARAFARAMDVGGGRDPRDAEAAHWARWQALVDAGLMG